MRFCKKRQRQGAQILRNEAYLLVRRTGSPKAKVFWGASDEGCSATQHMDFLRDRQNLEGLMKRILLVMIVGFAALAGGALSSVSAADLKIGFCDIDRAANDSEEGKKAIVGLRDYMASRQAT